MNTVTKLLIFLVIQLVVSSEFYIDHYELKSNDSVVSINITLKTKGSRHVYDADVRFLKDIGMALMVKTTFFRVMTRQNRQKLLDFPKFNYCDMRNGAFGMLSAYQKTFESFYQYGNLTMPCPFRKGTYYMRDVWVDLSLYPTYMLKFGNGLYLIRSVVTEVSKGRTVWISSSDLYMKLVIDD